MFISPVTLRGLRASYGLGITNVFREWPKGRMIPASLNLCLLTRCAGDCLTANGSRSSWCLKLFVIARRRTQALSRVISGCTVRHESSNSHASLFRTRRNEQFLILHVFACKLPVDLSFIFSQTAWTRGRTCVAIRSRSIWRMNAEYQTCSMHSEASSPLSTLAARRHMMTFRAMVCGS
jgi:hypothetical protein